MHPLLIGFLIGIVAFGGPRLIKTGLANGIFAFNKRRLRNKFLKEQQKKYKNAKKLEKEQAKGSEMSTQINQSMLRVQDILFKNNRTNQKEKLRVSEIAKFDDAKDVLLKGRLHIVDSTGKRTVQDIYLFQPRVFCSEVQVGPKLNKFGNMSDEHTYLCRRSGQTDILSGYVPKREVLSGMRYDYVPNGRHTFVERNPIYQDYGKGDLRAISDIEQFIHIDIPKDENGNFIPVNLSNVNELKDFQNYVKRHQMNCKNNGITVEEYFEKEFEKAQRSLVKYIQDYEPTYIPVASKVKVDEPETLKVEQAKKAETSINDYYKRFDYYMDPRFGEKYNNYDGKFGGPHHPHPHHHR